MLGKSRCLVALEEFVASGGRNPTALWIQEDHGSRWFLIVRHTFGSDVVLLGVCGECVGPCKLLAHPWEGLPNLH